MLFAIAMTRIALLLTAAVCFVHHASAQNQPPVVTNQLPDLTIYAGAFDKFVDATAGFRDPDVSNAVRMITPQGPIDVALYGAQKPITVANFLRYVNEGRYFPNDPTTGRAAPSFIHRSATNFVIQGGGFAATVNPGAPANLQPTQVLTFPPILNEPGISNKRGTIAMAKLGGDPNSATSQWFFNLADNSANLDTQNGGFTVFGRVVNGTMSTVDTIAALPIGNFGSPFDTLPVMNYVTPNAVRPENTVRLTSIDLIGPLNFSAQTDAPGVATVRTSGKNLIIKPIANGTARITVTATDFDGASVAQAFNVTVATSPGRLSSISTRGFVGTGDEVLIAGFNIRGTSPKRVLIRANGPVLGQLNVPGSLANPTLRLQRQSDGVELGVNNDWETTTNHQEIFDMGYGPANASESAILTELPASPAGIGYTAIVAGGNNTTGLALVEVYDFDGGPGSLLNSISTRGKVGVGDNVMIGGFIIKGTESRTVLARAIGPSLIPFNVPNVLLDPTIELRNEQGDLLFQNDNWREVPSQEQAIIATGNAPSDDRESAFVQTLAPGNYTVIMRGKNNTQGTALVEIYRTN